MKTNHISFKTLALGACALGALMTAAQAHAAEFTVAPQGLSEALQQFARQGDQQVLFSTSAVAGKKTAGFSGEAPPELALNQLLAGTGLTWSKTTDGALLISAPEGGSPQGGSVAGGGAYVEELVVTAQKKEEQIQDVPIAISAFTQKSLDAQKIEGGFDLLKAIPNVTFSKNNFTGYNFSIRGVGTKAISATTDPGVAVSFNNTTLIVNRLFEQEYFDVDRVEVLRGPQGTLYGRNATSGVINVISARPQIGEFNGDIELEGGNYNARRVRGMVNIPIGDTLALRVAGATTTRDGYGTNLLDGSDVDDRNLWSTRVTLGWEPNERFRANLLWERFEEDDERVRTSKQLCTRDPGPDSVGDFDVDASRYPLVLRGSLSQTCLPGSLYAEEAFQTPNGFSLPYVLATFVASPINNGMGLANPATSCPEALALVFAFPLDYCKGDPYANATQSHDLRDIESRLRPEYKASADIFELSFDVDLTDSLTLTSQSVYVRDETYATQDFNRFSTQDNYFTDTSQYCGNFSVLFGGPCNPGTWAGGFYNDLIRDGIFVDPQLGPSDTLLAQDLAKADSKQYSQEIRLASSFDSAVNFALGANYTRFDTLIDYYVFLNTTSLLAQLPLFRSPTSECTTQDRLCIYIDPNPLESINGDGHNYFRSGNPYQLTSSAIFGEIYWQATETVKVTGGLRLTWDRKTFTPVPSQLLLIDYREILGADGVGLGPEACTDTIRCPLAGDAPGGRGYMPELPIVQEWREPTGRVVVDWKPDLVFTDETMIYGSISHGYKGGGANPPSVAAPSGLFIAAARGADAAKTFEPEFVNAFEVGTKNVLLGGGLILNAAAFYYDYEGYQVSKIVDRSAANENFDAEVWGLELEWIFSPMRNLRFNGTFGHLQTRIADGEQSIDLMDRTQGGNQSFTTPDGRTFDSWIILKPWLSNTSNCIIPEIYAEAILEDSGGNLFNGNLCLGGGQNGASYAPGRMLIPGYNVHFNPLTDAPNAGAGFFDDLSGNELPNAPHWTASLGVQYSLGLAGGWEATLRGDFYWQAQSFARVYNTQYDKLRAWTNTNVSLWFEQAEWGVTAEVYVKNAFDETPITDAFLNSDDSGLTTNVFTLDPRLIGVSIRKSF